MSYSIRTWPGLGGRPIPVGVVIYDILLHTSYFARSHLHRLCCANKDLHAERWPELLHLFLQYKRVEAWSWRHTRAATDRRVSKRTRHRETTLLVQDSAQPLRQHGPRCHLQTMASARLPGRQSTFYSRSRPCWYVSQCLYTLSYALPLLILDCLRSLEQG